MTDNLEERAYLNLLEEVLEKGHLNSNRTGIDTLNLFSKQLRFNLQTGFPILTSKKVFFKTSLAEMLWFLSGSTDVNNLPKFAQKIWRSWANEDGDIGKTYGYQFRNSVKWLHHLYEEDVNDIKINKEFQSINYYNSGRYSTTEDVKITTDQVKRLEYLLKNNQKDRRMIIVQN
jgi:thymidylate synthase